MMQMKQIDIAACEAARRADVLLLAVRQPA